MMMVPLTLTKGHLTGSRGETRRDVESRVAEEKVPRPQQQGHGLGRHDRVILRGGEMGQAEGVPEHEVGVGDVGARVGRDPVRETAGR